MKVWLIRLLILWHLFVILYIPTQQSEYLVPNRYHIALKSYIGFFRFIYRWGFFSDSAFNTYTISWKVIDPEGKVTEGFLPDRQNPIRSELVSEELVMGYSLANFQKERIARALIPYICSKQDNKHVHLVIFKSQKSVNYTELDKSHSIDEKIVVYEGPCNYD